MVEYASDEQGRLLFAFSALSSHTGDVRKDGRASFTIPSPSFKACFPFRHMSHVLS